MKVILSFDGVAPEVARQLLTYVTGNLMADVEKYQFNAPAASVGTTGPELAAPQPAPAAPAPVIPPMPQNVSDDDYEEDDDTPETAPEFDADGLPWDERIHGSKMTKNADGRWRKRKGAENVEAIEAELKAKYAHAPVMQMPHTAPAQAAPVMQMPAAAAPAPVMQMPHTAPAQAAPAPVAGQIDGTAFMAHLTSLMQKPGPDGKPLVDFNYLQTLTQEIGTAFNVPLSAVTDIIPNQQQVTYAIQCMQRDGKWQ